MMPSRRMRNGFTLIELLTVIAIIAILAAIIFPTFARVAEQRRITQCMTQLHDIVQDVKLYEMDNNKYPAALYGLVQDTSKNFYTGSGSTVPMDQATYRPLMTGQKYLQDKGVFHCPDSNNNDLAAITGAIYPPNLPLTGNVTFTEAVAHNLGNESLAAQNMYFYTYDSYDAGPQVDKNGNVVQSGGAPVMELHYSLDWTGGAGSDDKPNQLKYAATADHDHTVVTWCTYHVATSHGNMVPVVLLSGTAKAVPVDRFVQQGPLNFSF